MNYKVLSECIAEYLRGSGSAKPPGTRLLARHFGASPETVRKSLKDLEERGLLSVRSRRSMLVKRNDLGTPPTAQMDAAQRLRNRLIQEINQGRFAAGESLPKILSATKEYAVSGHTVRRAYRILLEENYARRVGRSHVVTSTRRTSRSQKQRPLTICVYMHISGSWESLQASERTAKFAQTFLQECEKNSVYLNYIPCDRIISGRIDLQSFVSDCMRSEDLDIIGALVVGAHHALFPVAEIVHSALLTGKPVVWMDPAGDRIAGLPRHRLFTRCHFDERSAVHTALRFLSDHGHRRIVYYVTEDKQWQRNRGFLLHEEAHTSFPDLTLSTETFHSQYMRFPNPGITERLDSLQARGVPEAENALRGLLTLFDSLVQKYGPEPCECPGDMRHRVLRLLIDWKARTELEWEMPEREWMRLLLARIPLQSVIDRGATAVISPNDAMARSFILPWILESNHAIPDDFSVISFDCRTLPMQAPLTSVDFGFGYLGEQAFHALFRRGSTVSTRRGDIPARARTVDRGSVGWR